MAATAMLNFIKSSSARQAALV